MHQIDGGGKQGAVAGIGTFAWTLAGEAGDVHARETRPKGVDHGVHPLALFETFQPRLCDLLIGHRIWTKLLYRSLLLDPSKTDKENMTLASRL